VNHSGEGMTPQPWRELKLSTDPLTKVACALRQAAIEADDARHFNRELPFHRWRIAEPVMAEAVLLWMRNAMEQAA
jgi:hypothetical protein